MTHYDILGVSADASEETIKKAYKKLAFQFHPDRNTDPKASAKFQEVNEANEILSDSLKRQNYNAQLNGSSANQVQFRDVNDIFKSFFSNNSHAFQGNANQFFQTINKPAPIIATISITLIQAFLGGSFPLELERWSLINNIRTNEKFSLYVTLPAGIDEHEFIIIQGSGNTINNTIGGDIKIHIKISNDTLFKRRGLDLIYNKTITLKEALCGFEFDIKHINDKSLSFKNNINPFIIKPGFKKTIADYGMKRDTNTGNLIIEFDIVFPDTLTPEHMQKISEIL
jgi:DnaJ-class molecular chaperone